ncbi:GTPase RsgA [Bacillus coahuilensis p1.1.43]|uniref:Small ribosomal subunit biogenesis GTPase RsgA n=1 Tax=Bacillus coahuilensis p1.1.43 TaxID=1150625 RepID=A0A147K831_9BACI|nr:ribosome small subunit-dependent GTPase A [Bacillus coahuilensis]KUP06313.1 GTPase RsgA [Bacillus coahuilensis p1.1.43]
MNELMNLGFQPFFEDQLTQTEWTIGRIATASNGIYKILSGTGDIQGRLSGKFHHDVQTMRDFPCVGDWVLFKNLPNENKGIIQQVFKRKTLLSRQAAGDKQEEQLMAANIDTVFLVNALNKDFNLRRMERYLTQVYESGASPVFILTKKDLSPDAAEKVAAVESIAFGVPVLSINTFDQDDLTKVKTFIQSGKTISLIGSSGVGKSTLINSLLGYEIQKTGGVREEDSKGRHTTTHRELFVIPEGGIIIDTPGMRELQLWVDEETTSEAFQDIKKLATDCRFRDCKHLREPGCAIKNAIDLGTLAPERYQSYLKLQNEARFLDLKEEHGVHRAAKIQGKERRKQNNK